MCQKNKNHNIMINMLTIRMRNKLKYSAELQKLKNANVSNIITILTMLVYINFEM